MNIRSLHHAQVTIPTGAEDRARHFYCDVLGLREVQKPRALQGRGGIWLQVGDRQVHLGTEDGVDRHATKAHLAYEVADIDAARETLRQHAIAIFESVPIPGYDRCEFRDPFGNRVEVLCRKNSVISVTGTQPNVTTLRSRE
ncbi:MAG: VOC family protein [Chloroflexota bacterium]